MRRSMDKEEEGEGATKLQTATRSVVPSQHQSFWKARDRPDLISALWPKNRGHRFRGAPKRQADPSVLSERGVTWRPLHVR